ncbi:MAG: hypothetical protein Q9N32_01400 [Gammaproteobacteria bacterium]|nr:hypothetical protein [Gammaproteobacteria bacterium]
MKHEDVKQILFNIGNQFDVITIDARKKLLNSINSWRSLLA